eukprot:1174359-Amphidinium_carterae.1
MELETDGWTSDPQPEDIPHGTFCWPLCKERNQDTRSGSRCKPKGKQLGPSRKPFPLNLVKIGET